MKLRRWCIWAIALIFSVYETHYFGWNSAPRSSAEVICDGIVMLLVAMSLLLGD